MTSRFYLLPSLAMVFLLSSCSWVDKGTDGNIPPRSADDSFVVNEGGTLELLTYEEGVLGNDEDGGNRQLVARVVENTGPAFAANAGFTFNPDGTFTYTHNGDEPPPAVKVNDETVRHCDFFSYIANDGIDDGEQKSVCIDIIPVNDIPVITGQKTLATVEDNPVSIAPSDLVIKDPDNNVEDFQIVIKSSDYYQVEQNTVHPNENYNGELDVELTVSDGIAESEVFRFKINVIPDNDAPQITQKAPLSTLEDTPLTIDRDRDLTIVDIDNVPEDFTLTVEGFEGGNYSVDPDQVTVIPNGDYSGPLEVRVLLTDGEGQITSKTLKVDVTAVNDAPVITGQDAVNTPEEEPLEIAFNHLTVFDPDNNYPDDFTLTVQDGANYSLDGNTITPALDFSGELSVPVVVNDGELDSDIFELKVTVTPVNDPPVAEADTASTNEDTAVTSGNVLANDTDADGDTLSVSAADATSAQGGSVVNNNNGTFTYTPAANFNGSDSFSYTVSDGNGGTAQGTVTVTVTAQNDPPVIAAGQIFNVDENLASTPVNPGPVLASDVENDTLSYAIDGANPGNFTINSVNGQISTSTAFDFETQPTQYTLTIKVTDNGTPAQFTTQTVTININDVGGLAASVNQPPQVTGTCKATPLNVPVLNIPLNASDPDGDDSQLRFYRVTNGSKGNATVDITGRFSYTPYSDARGTDTFIYRVVDQQGAETLATVKVIIGSTRIMPLGDAITAGSTDGSNTTSGYRQVLRSSLTDLGYAVEFVGSQGMAPDRHEGHLGSQVTSAHISGNIEGWLSANPADVVLLHIGSQDFASGGDVSVSNARIGNILDAIDAWAAAAGQRITVLLAEIIDQQPANAAVTAFNRLVLGRAQPDKVIVVDQHGALDYPADLADGLHPNSTGYQKMAAAWRGKLTSGVLDKCP